MKLFSRENLVLAVFVSVVGIALNELWINIKNGNIIVILSNFGNASASVKFLVVLMAFLVVMVTIRYILQAPIIFSIDNIVRASTAALGLALVSHFATSGINFAYYESILFGIFLFATSIISILDIYKSILYAPASPSPDYAPQSGDSITGNTLRIFLDSSNQPYESLTKMLRNRGISFKKRDLTPRHEFDSAAVALHAVGINEISELEKALTIAHAHLDLLQSLVRVDQRNMALQTDLIKAVAAVSHPAFH